MAEPSRYSVSQKRAGLENGILKNKLNIREQVRLDNLETLLLEDAHAHYFKLLEQRKLAFNLDHIFNIHKFFLNTLYSWAGKTRTVDISKNDFLFVPTQHLQLALKEFEKELPVHIPEPTDTKNQIAQKLAWIHTEFNFIHPFREGNGRTIRLFLDLLAAYYGYEPIDYNTSTKTEYITACVAGMSKNYKPMEKVMSKGLRKRK